MGGSTAVFWKSESGDYYLHSYPYTMTKAEAKKKMVEIYGDEFTDYCCDFLVENN